MIYAKKEIKPSIFLSSAIIGLEDLRSILARYFEEIGYQINGYGDISSGPRSGKPGIVDECLNGVRESDYFVLIVDRRYGSPEHEDNGDIVSMTELEFREACKLDRRRWIFCRDAIITLLEAWKKNPDMDFSFDFRFDHPQHLMKFISKIGEQYEVIPFKDAGHLLDILEKIRPSADVLKYKAEDTEEDAILEVTK